MFGPRTLVCDVELKQTSNDALQHEEDWTYSFSNSFSASEAGKGLLFIVYRIFNINIGLF